MPTESDTIIKNIVPRLEAMGWQKDRMEFEKACKAGHIDLLYNDVRGRPLVVLEAKRPKKSIKKVLEEQAIPYAKSIKAPIVIVWDGVTQLETHHMKKGSALLDYDDKIINHSNVDLLSESNLMFLRKNPSLNTKIKNAKEIDKAFKDLNILGRKIGLTDGVERVTEIAKILFIKMLCDNYAYLSTGDWDSLREAGEKRVIRSINDKIGFLGDEGISLPKLNINKTKSREVWKIIELLETINFNSRYYGDVAGSLFEHFLSSRAKGKKTSDLGQYFTPKKINELICRLAGYESGMKVYDPFCGTGGILLEFFQQQNSSTEQQKRKFAKSSLYGSELTETVSQIAKMNMVIAGDGHTNIQGGLDSLSCENPYVADQKRFDIVATNMPFVPSVPSDTPDNYFSIAYDQNDVCKFIEHSINSCKVGGKVVLIVGKGFLTENASGDFRRRLLDKHCLEAVYTLYGGVFHPYTQAHSVMLVISKGKRNQKETVDFFSVKNDDDIRIAKRFYNKESRYKNDYYKIKTTDILKNENCDFRGAIYKTDFAEARISDLANLVESEKVTGATGKKMTTPNAVRDGLYLIETQSNKLVADGEDSFCHEIKEGAIIIARIVGNRKEGKYLGSAIAGRDVGNLITAEYHQIIPKNPKDFYFILDWFRGKDFQRIIELAKGTGGQQRIESKFIMNAPIPKPTSKLREQAYDRLMSIETDRIVALTDKMSSFERANVLKQIQTKYHNDTPEIDENRAKMRGGGGVK